MPELSRKRRAELEATKPAQDKVAKERSKKSVARKRPAQHAPSSSRKHLGRCPDATTISSLVEHFEAELAAVARLMRQVLGEPRLEAEDSFLLTDQQREDVLVTIALNTAACRQCQRAFVPSGVGSEQCQCGRNLGRCPVCRRFTSFRLTKKHLLARDDFACESCGAEVAACSYGKADGCERWAPKTHAGWQEHCLVCEHDSSRIADKKRFLATAEAFGEAIGQRLSTDLRSSSTYQQAMGRTEDAVFNLITRKK